MVSAGIVLENCLDCSVTGGSVTGFEAGVIATNTRGLKVNGNTFETIVGIVAEDCSNVNFSGNHHKQPTLTRPVPMGFGQTNIPHTAFGMNPRKPSPGLSVTMYYALNYLKCSGYNPYS